MTITICDVGPRDGLQNEAKVLPPAPREPELAPIWWVAVGTSPSP